MLFVLRFSLEGLRATMTYERQEPERLNYCVTPNTTEFLVTIGKLDVNTLCIYYNLFMFRNFKSNFVLYSIE